jgi:hypothetical protein
MNPYEDNQRELSRGRDRERRDRDRGRGRGRGRGDIDRERDRGDIDRGRDRGEQPSSRPDRSRSRNKIDRSMDVAVREQQDTFPDNACQTYFRPSDLLIYQIMNSHRIHNDNIQVLNYCTNILQQQILDTKSLPPTNKSQMDPCTQKNLFCIEKESKNKGVTTTTIEKNEGTIRAIGLFKKSDIQSAIEKNASPFNPRGVMLNKLTSTDDSYKFAIASFEGNPNGVLGMCLCSAANNLTPRGIPKGDKDTITTISNESRGATEQVFVETILNSFMTQLQSNKKVIEKNPTKVEEALTTITKTYGPLVNKGLSDISQAGELAKYYILKYIEGKLMPLKGTIHCDTSDSTGENFWNITSGLPSLVAFSSDAIASVLGVRIQKSFKGQFQSILPRKHGKGRYSVVYIPYEYIYLMIMLHNNTVLAHPRSENIKQTFTHKIQWLEQNYKISFATSDYFSDNFFNSLRVLVDNIYIIFKRYGPSVHGQYVGFSKSIIDIIDNMFIPYINSYDFSSGQVSPELHDLINTARDFKNIFGQLYLNKGITGTTDQNILIQTSTKDSFEVIRLVLLAFGELIQLLKDYVTLNKQQLIDASRLLQPGQGTPDYLELPGWTGILYSTISYYDNCCDFNNKTVDELLQLYLNISVTEESCAEQDVDYGHDQAAHNAVQKLGIMVARDWFAKDEPIRTHLSTQMPNSKIHEEVFSKSLIDGEEYFSVALTYNTTGNPILRINITSDPYVDFIYNTSYNSPIASGSVINIRPIGNIETWGSIDYTIGDPFINKTKSGRGNIQNEEKYYKQFIKYFEEENIIEIRTPTTDFDAAAPSGCLYKTTEKMCVSYREFIPLIGKSVNSEGYLFVILTLNLNDDSQNNLMLSEGKCLAETGPPNIFNTGKGIQRADTITELQTQFSRPLTQGTELQKEKLYGQKIRTLIQECYNKPETGFKTFLKSHVGKKDLHTLLSGIDEQLTFLNNILAGTTQKGSKGTDAEKLFKQTAPGTFKEIIKNIGEYCSRCQQDLNCGDDEKIVIKDLLKIMYSCMFGQQITGEIERIMLSLDKLVEREEERIGISAASALLSLADSNSELDEEVSDDDVIMGEDLVHSTKQRAYAASSPSGFGQGFGATAATAINPEKGFGTIQQNSALEFFAEAARIPTQGSKFYIDKTSPSHQQYIPNPEYIERKNEVLRRMAKQYPGEDTHNLYSQALNYWLNQEKRINIFEEGVEDQMEAIDSFYRSQRGGRNRKLMNQKYKNINTRKLYKIYKRNKRNTKRRNKRVRKTKKRQIKRKRITRRR